MEPDISTEALIAEALGLQKGLGIYDTVPLADQQASDLSGSANRIRQLFAESQKPEKRGVMSYAPAALTGLGALIDLLSGDEDRQAAIGPKTRAISDRYKADQDKKAAAKRQALMDALGIETTVADLGSKAASARIGAREQGNLNKRAVLNDAQQLAGSRQTAFNAGEDRKLRREQFTSDEAWRDYLKQDYDRKFKLEQDKLRADSGADIPDSEIIRSTYEQFYEEERKLQNDKLKNATTFEERQKIEDEIDAIAEYRTAKKFKVTPQQLQEYFKAQSTEEVFDESENPYDNMPAVDSNSAEMEKAGQVGLLDVIGELFGLGAENPTGGVPSQYAVPAQLGANLGLLFQKNVADPYEALKSGVRARRYSKIRRKNEIVAP